MRRPPIPFVFLAVSTALLACSNGAPPAVPGSPASSGAPASSAAPGAGGAATEAGAPGATKAGGKATRTAAECPSTGEAIAPPGSPSVGKARHDEIVAIFQKHREKFRCCYDVARQQTPALKGNYSIEIVLKTDGTIKQVLPKKEASEIHDEGMDSCVFTVAKALQFSPNAEGKETTIPYQFGFTPGGGRLPVPSPLLRRRALGHEEGARTRGRSAGRSVVAGRLVRDNRG